MVKKLHIPQIQYRLYNFDLRNLMDFDTFQQFEFIIGQSSDRTYSLILQVIPFSAHSFSCDRYQSKFDRILKFCKFQSSSVFADQIFQSRNIHRIILCQHFFTFKYGQVGRVGAVHSIKGTFHTRASVRTRLFTWITKDLYIVTQLW